MILVFLFVTVCVPVFLISKRLKLITSLGGKEFIEDLSSIKYRTDGLKLNAIEQESGKGLKEPSLVVYKDGDFNNVVSYNENQKTMESRNAGGSLNLIRTNETKHDGIADLRKVLPSTLTGKEASKQTAVRRDQNVWSQSQSKNEKVKEMKDQLIRAKAYLNFAPPTSNSHLVKELKLRIKEVERALGDARKDSDLSRSAVQRMRTMEASLLKASRIYTDCSAMATKLRAMTYNTEEQVRAQKNEADFLVQIAGRTTPKGLHCLSMRLTAEYFALQPEERVFSNQDRLHDKDLHHYAVFSDNVMACAVVVNSTVSTAMESEKIVFHIVTDSLNLPAISMWFVLNPPGKATIHIQSIDNFEGLAAKFGSTLKQQNSLDPRYTSALNHLRFYLPDVFPMLNKILLLDHDVVVQRDLTRLWSVNMKGKVNGAVETCREGEVSFRQMDMFINFSDPLVTKKFDANACTWAFGMNLFDLQEWRKQNISALYHKYLQLGNRRQLWKAGSLPIGWVTFYKQTVALDRRWHILGLGYDSGLGRGDIERAAVIHYDGVMKPWLEIGIGKYKGYWSKHINYNHPFLQQCNIHQ